MQLHLKGYTLIPQFLGANPRGLVLGRVLLCGARKKPNT